MTRDILMKKTIEKIQKLPESKLKEVSDFADFLLNKINNQILTDGIMQLTAKSKSFDFLNNEEDLYTKNDLKEIYTDFKQISSKKKE
ncbi:MAG: hypothetical protein A2275_04465 [Bacteroidetes bacterium RIFOXYA12_FULL_35_11]|nr:MAG: hypothetical protein A2X01_07755 [Bacteroidetes bacterium GWF2_35_48]OFY75564.1 MAG: hypothetical protein A2275_04465 [Bacteroidetes bacterium RIFOXYA12_FULL_35_11]OFY99156.1 MAG: hypothetical protein A2491_12960 [Bacteroidetes bacterium RIFOXYC12_FULL_35_7]HBX49800.1 hypothetical protein [Bacteroidales bacterium]